MALTKISGEVIQSELNIGIVTATQVNVGSAVTIHSGGFIVGGSDLHSTGLTVQNLNATGVVTATSFIGDGSALTGIDATALKDFDGNVKIQANTSGAVVTGVLTATSFSGDGSALTGIAAGIAATTNVRTNSLVVSGVSTLTELRVGTAVTISAGIITATTVRASSISASGGTTAERPADAVTGTIRYNTVSGTLEYFDGTHWLAINAAGYRGIFGGGAVYPGGPFSGPAVNTIDYITIAALGDAQDFGDLTNITTRSSALSSSTRGVFGASAFTNNILDYVTIATTGNALDFGDDIVNPLSGTASNETRGLFAGGYIHNVIRYITIASTGDAIDFGDLIEQKWSPARGPVSSSTRGIFAGGSAFAPTKTNRIDYVTIASTGNSINFGDMIVNMGNNGACSSSTRGLFCADGNIDYIEIASTGNSVDFGGGSVTRTNAAASNNIRGVFVGGYITNVMSYVTIATLGNAIDFGDLTTVNRWNLTGTSNGHGGLQ